VLGKELGRKVLAKVATIATPDTILRWYRELVVKKYDGSQRRGPGRPRKRGKIDPLVRTPIFRKAFRCGDWRNSTGLA
jgi:hypothetical protein